MTEGRPPDEPESTVADEPESTVADEAQPAVADEAQPRASDEPEPTAPNEPELPPSPFAALEPRSRRVLSTAFDTLTHSSADLRGASFYIGLLVLGLAAPMALLVWRLAVEAPELTTVEQLALAETGFEGWLSITALVAVGGLLVATVESRGVAISLLAARLAGRPVDLRDAVRRSRTSFWRLVWAGVLANVPLLIVQSVLQSGAADVLGGESEFSVLGASILTAALFAPLAYVQSGVVLGDLGPVQTLRRSFGVFRAGRRLAVVVALFEFGAQFVTLFGLGAGLDLVLRVTDVTGLGAGTGPLATAFTAALIVILVFAVGTLIFTVAAIATAPQVVAYLALTQEAPGLYRLGHDVRRFRWLTRPTLAAMVVATLALLAGLSALI